MDEKKIGVPWQHYVSSLLIVLAFVAVAVIPSTMVYRLRLFSAVGLPENFAEVLRIVIICATPFAVFATGVVRTVAVSDEDHAGKIAVAAGLEILSMAAEILAALVNAENTPALIAQAVFLIIAIVSISAALVITMSASGFYKLAVSRNELALIKDREYANLFRETVKGQAAREAMTAKIIADIKEFAKVKPGSVPPTETTEPSGNGKGRGNGARPLS